MDLVDDSSMPFPPMDEDDDLEISSRLSGVDNGRAFTPKETAVIYSREIDSQASNKSNGKMLYLKKELLNFVNAIKMICCFLFI